MMSTREFNTQIDQYAKILLSFAYNLTKSTEESKDLYQETAYRALINRDKFQAGTNFKAWLFTIMKNIFINNYRKKAKVNMIMDSTDNQHFINSGSHVVNNDAESNILVEELYDMVDNLDSSLRVPFVMHFEGYKYQEIAEELDLPLGTVKSRIFFARKELKSEIYHKHHGIFEAWDKEDRLAS
jgi:RNA polymerase sigma-70 factor (ECF subfamily)